MQEYKFDQKAQRELYNEKNIRRLKNKNFSLIASNCNGAFICHDLKLRFNSPTVNLFIYPDDFLKYVKNLAHYCKCNLTFIKEKDISYPVGLLGDIKIYFMHYKNEQEAAFKWAERAKRIDFNNIFIMMTDRDGCTLEHMKEFDELPYKYKVIFTHKQYVQIKSAFYIPGFENEGQVGDIFAFKNDNTEEKYYDLFDYVGWFNSAID